LMPCSFPLSHASRTQQKVAALYRSGAVTCLQHHATERCLGRCMQVMTLLLPPDSSHACYSTAVAETCCFWCTCCLQDAPACPLVGPYTGTLLSAQPMGLFCC
jgi:hypothetical protein